MAATPRTPSPQLNRSFGAAPDAPLHGARFDESPRRSRRSTSNPYSTQRSPSDLKVGKRRSQLSSPPSSPASPTRTRSSPISRRMFSIGEETTANIAQHNDRKGTDRKKLLATPAKNSRLMTPPSTGTARRVIFQHADPNDIMPTPRKLKKLGRNNPLSSFLRPAASEQIEVYNDASARVPTRDESEDNPFIGQRFKHSRSEARHSPAPVEPLSAHMSNEEMQKRADNEEGLIFTFRGKKTFRPYEDSVDAEFAKSLGYKPIRRSRTKPLRLTFGVEAPAEDHADEEALTEIEDEGELSTALFTETIESQGPADAGSPKQYVRSVEKSMFGSWRRVRDDVASTSRKRDAMEHGGDSTSKRSRSSP